MLMILNTVYNRLYGQGDLGKVRASAESIQHSNYALANNKKNLRTVATFRNLIGLSFQRLASTTKLIVYNTF